MEGETKYPNCPYCKEYYEPHILNDEVQDCEGRTYTVITVACTACGTAISSQAVLIEK